MSYNTDELQLTVHVLLPVKVAVQLCFLCMRQQVTYPPTLVQHNHSSLYFSEIKSRNKHLVWVMCVKEIGQLDWCVGTILTQQEEKDDLTHLFRAAQPIQEATQFARSFRLGRERQPKSRQMYDGPVRCLAPTCDFKLPAHAMLDVARIVPAMNIANIDLIDQESMLRHHPGLIHCCVVHLGPASIETPR